MCMSYYIVLVLVYVLIVNCMACLSVSAMDVECPFLFSLALSFCVGCV